MSEVTHTINLTAAQLNSIVDALLDVSDVLRRADEAAAEHDLGGLNYDRQAIGALADDLHLKLNPSWTPDAVDDGLNA